MRKIGFSYSRVLALFALLLTLLSCIRYGSQRAEETEEVFPAQVATIFRDRCQSCHSSERAGGPAGGLNLNTWSTLMQGVDSIPSTGAGVLCGGEPALAEEVHTLVVPGSPNWSHLLGYVNGKDNVGPTSPLPLLLGHTISKEEVASITAWIAAGARSAKGQAPSWAWQHPAGRIFFLCSGADVIGVADAATGNVYQYIPVGNLPSLESPHYLALSPDGQYLYLTLIVGGTVEKYRTNDGSFVGRVVLGSSPAHIVLSPDGSRALITHFTDAEPLKLSLINTATMQIVAQVRGGQELLAKPHGLAVDSSFTHVYITANRGSYVQCLRLSPSGFQGIARTYFLNPSHPESTAEQPYQVLLSADGSKLYVSCEGTNDVRIVGVATGRVEAIIAGNAAGEKLGTRPRLMQQVGQRLFVACELATNPRQRHLKGCISVINLATLTLEKNLWNVGMEPHGLALDSHAGKLYITLENQAGTEPQHHATTQAQGNPGGLVTLDIHNLQVSGRTQTADFPTGVVFAP